MSTPYMEITDISVTPVSCTFERQVKGSQFEKERRETIILTVETDEDVRGRVYSGDFGDVGTERRRTITRLIEDELAPIAIGRDAFATESIWEAMFEGSKRFLNFETETRWLFVHAIGAIDTAIWDAIGKRLNTPLYELWGGYTDELPFISAVYYEENKGRDELVEEVQELKRAGMAGIKLKVGRGSIDEDIARLKAVREAMGEKFIIGCDANQGWSAEEAVSFEERASQFGIRWLEEPVAWYDQYRGMAEVRERTNVPVCAGQSEYTASGCRRLIEDGIVDILNFDASWGGGPTVWRKVASNAELHGVELMHHEEPHISMHLLASVPNGLYAEGFPPGLDPVFYRMVENTPPIEDGYLQLPDGPGIGLSLDEEFIEDHRVD